MSRISVTARSIAAVNVDFTNCAIQCRIRSTQKIIGGIERWLIQNQRSSGFAVQSVGVYATGIFGEELEPL